MQLTINNTFKQAGSTKQSREQFKIQDLEIICTTGTRTFGPSLGCPPKPPATGALPSHLAIDSLGSRIDPTTVPKQFFSFYSRSNPRTK